MMMCPPDDGHFGRDVELKQHALLENRTSQFRHMLAHVRQIHLLSIAFGYTWAA